MHALFVRTQTMAECKFTPLDNPFKQYSENKKHISNGVNPAIARILRVIISLASCHITTNTFIINKNARA